MSGPDSERQDSDPEKPEPLRILDTYVRALEKLSRLAPEVTALESEVAAREAVVLRRILGLLDPVFPRLAGPLVIREPWLDGRGEGVRLREPGAFLVRNFQGSRDANGRNVHVTKGLVLLSRGRLLEVDATARWSDATGADASWHVQTTEVEPTPEFAAANLRATLAGVLDVLREALVRAHEGKRELRERLERLAEAERALEGRPDAGRR
jgi:hypothetical protein